MCIQYDPVTMRRSEGDDEPVTVGNMKSEAAQAWTQTFHDEVDHVDDVDNP